MAPANTRVVRRSAALFDMMQNGYGEQFVYNEFMELKKKYKWNPPMFKESLYYRELFNKHYPGREQTIPYYWLPKWSGDIVEPSARVLTDVYKSE